jgi:hypothetical protein
MQIALEHALWLMVLVPLLLIALSSILFRSLPSRKLGDKRSNIYQCEHCRRVYVDERKVPLSRCPGCRRLNEALRR